MRTSRLILAGLMILLSFGSTSLAHAQGAQPITQQGIAFNRSNSLTIKIVFLGITADEVNSTYLTSNVTVPLLKYQTILAGPVNTGVIYNFNYQFVFASNSTVTSFAQYLLSIQQEQTTNATAGRPYALVNPYFSNSTTLKGAMNYFYDADKVESWLGLNMAQFGAMPTNGYTIFVADLTDYGIPSFSFPEYQNYTLLCGCAKTIVHAHYYNRTVTDPDLGLVNNRHYMTGWGGSSRFYYMDLSAGPSYWTNELPVQVASGLRNTNPNSYYGKLWESSFIGSYVSGAVYNLFAADQLYPVNYSQAYNVHLFVIDNRTATEQARGPALASTIDKNMIQENLASLCPFATVTVDVRYASVTDYPSLATVIANSTTTVRDPSSGRPVVDGDLIYRWFSTNGLGHISSFINVTRTTSSIDIPTFIFALKGNYTFGVPVKEDIASENLGRTFSGEAFGDLVLIGLSQADLTLGNNTFYNQPGKGVGFTHATIHELGHMLGLNHPFIYDATEDFTDTVMGYYSYSLNYSQFDRDTILRGVNDELLSYALETLAATPNDLVDLGKISQANQDISRATDLYNTMNYSRAVQYSLAAAEEASSAQQLASLASPPLIFTLLGVALGATIGIVLAYLVFRRRKGPTGIQYNRCPTCQQPLRWDPVLMRWYCDRCQKPV